jgi:hypothetical protein
MKITTQCNDVGIPAGISIADFIDSTRQNLILTAMQETALAVIAARPRRPRRSRQVRSTRPRAAARVAARRAS